MRIVESYKLQRAVSTTAYEQKPLRVSSGTCQSSYGKIAALEGMGFKLLF